MAIDFLNSYLDTLYSSSTQANSFRTTGADDIKVAIDSLDKRIAAFESVIIDSNVTSGTNTYEYPYDKEGLKREWLQEVMVLLLKKLNTSGALYAGTALQNFDNMTFAQLKAQLGTTDQAVMDHYSSLIDAVFGAGEQLKNGPIDAATGDPVKATLITVIAPVTHNGVTYGYTTEIGSQTYLLRSDANTDTMYKDASGVLRFTGDVSVTNALPVNSVTLQPAAGAVATTIYQRLLTVTEYLYFWNEARIGILRAQLAYKEAITVELQEDLRQANAALAELERIAGGVRAQSEKGEPNPVSVSESRDLDLFEALVSTPNKQLFNTNAGDDIHNYSEWQENRTNLKNYIDRRSAQSQQAMLDYQTVLNRYNNAYEVMAKLQEKIQGLLSSQLRNM